MFYALDLLIEEKGGGREIENKMDAVKYTSVMVIKGTLLSKYILQRCLRHYTPMLL